MRLHLGVVCDRNIMGSKILSLKLMNQPLTKLKSETGLIQKNK